MWKLICKNEFLHMLKVLAYLEQNQTTITHSSTYKQQKSNEKINLHAGLSSAEDISLDENGQEGLQKIHYFL